MIHMISYLISRRGPRNVESGNAVCRSHNSRLLITGLTLTYFILLLIVIGREAGFLFSFIVLLY